MREHPGIPTEEMRIRQRCSMVNLASGRIINGKDLEGNDRGLTSDIILKLVSIGWVKNTDRLNITDIFLS
jgi:hypothetical protein